MKIDRIKYTKEFQYHGMSEWIGGEGALSETDNFTDCVIELKKQVVAAFNATISDAGMPVIQASDKLEVSGDAEFEELKKKLDEIPYREDAEIYLANNGWSFAIEAKNYISNKPLKNK